MLGAFSIIVDLSQNLYILKAHTRTCGHGKDKVWPTTGHKDPQGEGQVFSYVLGAFSIIVDLSQNLYILKAHTRTCGHGKDKVRPTTGHEDPQGEERYSSTLSLALTLDGVRGQRHAPAALTPGKRCGTHCVGG